MQTVGIYKASSLDQRQLKVQVNDAESGLYGMCGGSMKPSMSISSSVSLARSAGGVLDLF